MNIQIVYGFEPLTINSFSKRLIWNEYQKLVSSDKEEENKKSKKTNKKNSK